VDALVRLLLDVLHAVLALCLSLDFQQLVHMRLLSRQPLLLLELGLLLQLLELATVRVLLLPR